MLAEARSIDAPGRRMTGNTADSLKRLVCNVLWRTLVCMAIVIGAASACAADCPTSASGISADRPGFTNSATVVPEGSLQVESGVNWSAAQRSDVIDVPETSVRLGIANCTEILLDGPDYYYSTGGYAPSGFSDFVVSAKRQIGPLYRFDLSGTAGVSFPTGGSAVSSHGYDPYIQFPWAREVAENWSLGGMFSVYWHTSQPQSDPTFQPTLEVERDFGSLMNVFAEYAADFPDHARPTHLLDGGGVWRVTPRQQLDFNAGFGLNRPSPDHFFGIGYSFRLDGLF